MDLDEAVGHLLSVRHDMRQKRGINDPLFLSEQMQRLTQYNSALEEHLAVLEEHLEIEEMQLFLSYTKQGKSVNQAEILTKFEVGETKGRIARLKRLVNSSWSIISTAQSRINHLQREMQVGGSIT